MQQDIETILLTPEEIQEKVNELGKQLSADYADKKPLVIGLLTGAVFFMTDLVRSMSIPLELDFMDVSSYGNGTVSSGNVRIVKDLNQSVNNRHIIIVEDIIDTGRTLKEVIDLLNQRQAASIRVVALTDKPERREQKVKPDYTGFVIPNEFVVGYGLDYQQKYRHLPYIGVLKRELYENPKN